MKIVKATLKLAGVGIEISSVDFFVEDKTTDEEIDKMILQEFTKRLEVDFEIKPIKNHG